MPGPFGAYGAALGNVMSGQADAQQQMEMQRQLMQQRQVDEMIRRQQALMQMQAFQEQNEAMKTLSPEDRKAMVLGESYTDIVKNKTFTTERATQASAAADQFYQMSLDPSLPMDQRLRAASLSAQLRAHPELMDQIKDLSQGIGQRAAKPYILVDRDTGNPVDWTPGTQPPANAIPISEYNALHNPARMTPVQKFGNTPIGNLPGGAVMLKPDGTTFTDPRMTADDAIAQGGVMLSGAAAKQYNLSKSAEDNLKVLQQAGQQVLPATVPTGLGETVSDIYINPAKRYFLAKTDPRFAAYEHSKAGIISYVRDLANAGRINQAEMNIIVDRLNNAQTYPALQSAVDTARQIIVQDRQSLTKAGQFSRPVYDANGGVIGYTTDGKTMTPVGP